MTVEAWRLHPLMTDDHVQRWMRSRTLRSTYRLRSLRALDRYCQYRHLTPTELVGEAVESAMSPDPVKRLRPKDQLNRWREQLGTEYQSVVMIRQILPFYEENGCHIDMHVQNPKTPARETTVRATVELTRRYLEASPDPRYKWAILVLAESGMRPGSVTQIEYRDLSRSFESQEIPLAIEVRGRTTKTGMPYISFVLEDARAMLQTILHNPKPTDRIVNFSAETLTNYVSRLGIRLGVNAPTGLKVFTCKQWRRNVQNRLEDVGIPANRVSLLLGRTPRGTDSHYVSPPLGTLATEFLKAREALIVYP